MSFILYVKNNLYNFQLKIYAINNIFNICVAKGNDNPFIHKTH